MWIYMRIDECQDSLMDTLKFLFLADSNQDRREKLESMLKKESILFQRIEKAEGSEISGELSGIKENSASDSDMKAPLVKGALRAN
ncbi:hypothetical protein [Ileibacterium valens]|uniref:Uncharacterized protein n=1 Tax=Ileibacterium valens TaxID=1862668 RepID=A0A1U7NIP5_9FIRM|nr:hypothetical protein [Ileibacterium valens]OLU36109.1 hypothetical protein BO224_12990 [Erysipelotrichaceae bacterium NYU-BL-E8]OLU41790.1 hypothetical protein BM735_03625 [Erysipelotrichaceae bacterium NYU-BL-F16]OLU42529.1 hypothetical protein BO222_01415 [Ileibacterium valens]